MSQKIILTAEQHEKAINYMLNEMVNVDENIINEDGTINEGVWEKVKYGLSKLGRYKVGGKLTGRGKIDQEAATKIQAIIDKKGNEVIKALDAKIKETNSEFPNNEKGEEFLNTIMQIAAVYDSIIASTNKKPEEEGYLPIDAANGVINDLREYVKKFLDIDLKAVYSVVDEIEGNDSLNITEDELKTLDEAWEPEEMATMDDEEPEYIEFDDIAEYVDEDAADDTRKALQAKRGQGDDFDSERMKTLKSNKLPLILAAVGGSLGGLSWLAKTEWFKHWLEGLLGADHTVTTADITQQVTGGAPDSKGMLHWMGQIDGHQMKTGADVQGFIDKYGADNVKHMFEGNGGGSIDTQIQQLQQVIGGDNASKPVGQIFNPSNDTFGSMKGGQNLFGVSKAASFLGQIVLKKGATTLVKGAGTALATKFAGLAGILGPIGIGLFTAGALVKIMRMKGQKQSRAKTLNDLYQSIRNIEGGTGVIEPDGPTISKDEAQDPNAIEDKNKKGDEQGGVKGDVSRATSSQNDELYNTLRNLFQFVVNNRKKLGTRAADNVGTGGATLGGGKSTANSGFKKGDKVTYKGKNVTVTIPNVSPGYTQIDADGDGPEKKTYAVKTSDLQQLQEGILDEGKYIKDKRLVQFLQKNLSFDKLKAFEEFIGRVERIRTLIKKVDKSNDKVLANFIVKLDANPIMATDFVKMFNIDSSNPQAVNALKAFIDDMFITLYSGKYKFDSMIDKMAGVGGGNVNKLEEEAGYNASEPNKAFIKDAQDRGRFKKNLMNFLSDSIGIFQYLYKLKKEVEKGGGKTQKNGTTAKGTNATATGGSSASGSEPGETTATPPSSSDSQSTSSSTDSKKTTDDDDDENEQEFEPARYSKYNRLFNFGESVDNNKKEVIIEEIERIKKIMSGLS